MPFPEIALSFDLPSFSDLSDFRSVDLFPKSANRKATFGFR